MKKTTLTILFLGLILGSCSTDECEPDPGDSLTPVTFSPTMVDIQQVADRSVKLTWAQGDQITIFSDIAIKKNGSTSTSSITYTRGATEGVWTAPSADEEWYFADAVRQHNFYAYYPVGSATVYSAVQIPDISGQDGTKNLTSLKEENDFMRGTSVVIKNDMVANIQMYRVFTIINLKVKLKQDAFTNNAATLTDIKFTSTNSLPLVNPSSSDIATVNLSNGHVTCSDGLSAVTLHPSAGFALTPTEISIPIKIYPQNSTIQVQFTIGGKTSASQTLSTSSFVGGRIYNYSVEIGAGLQEIGIGDPIIFDWISNDGNPINPEI